ncbi:uncharacterized protein DUF3667 [Parasphingopyxis lamellibrachiae]|uniref:Uncharacterized protein DUF3667 n=2 Tax=Parasphingopyxis lamellibrachiae TaxID=680125 RepID=A0A3D9FKU1_9SPHN|nr:uncharacterized protein DUF3667 [Parasphingopyxis lamellibrachiae]
MDNGIEGIGDAITGGLAARAVEPDHGESASEHSETHCLNCSTELIGTHCHYCGQKAHVHRSISAIGHDLMHGVLHLDGKFWRTLPLLIWQPGQLTRRYIHGERAKFVSPLGMFLFGVFLMFGILTIYGASLSNIDIGDRPAVVDVDAARAHINTQMAEVQAEREAVDRRIAIAGSQPGQRARLAELAQEAAALDERIAEMEFGQDSLELIGGPAGEANISGTNISTGWARLDYGIQKINENPGLALYKLQANFYKFSWLLIPLSVPFVWLLFFYTRRFKMYDHTVFVTYSLAFMSLFAIILTVLGFAGMGIPWIPLAAVFIPFIHMYKQLRGTYQIGRISAFFRTVLLSFFCFTAAFIFFVMLLTIGALG